ncbi:MAG: hypothetical protein ACJAS5_000660 [Lentimonas sp.]|jgi:hypothetical protein
MGGGFASGSWGGRPPCRPLPIRCSLLGIGEGMTSVSSGTDAGEADLTNRPQIILEFNVISKLLAVDTEVDPPQQNRRHIRHRVVFFPVNDDEPFFTP